MWWVGGGGWLDEKRTFRILEHIFRIHPSLLIKDCAEDGGEEFLPRCTAFELQIFNDSIGIQLKNALHLGKNSSPPSLAQSSIAVENLYPIHTVIHTVSRLGLI